MRSGVQGGVEFVDAGLDQPAPGRLLRDLVRSCRPHQWVKNVFVLAPILFSHRLTHLETVLAGLLAFACFCLWSIAVYCVNDVVDAKADASHPTKRNRPIPSGRIAPPTALALAGLLVVVAGVGAAILGLPFVASGACYLANALVYCFLLKYRVIIDVISIAVGFVVRIVAGCLAIGVVPTFWILACGSFLAMLLGFGKRRLEVGTLAQPVGYRRALESYSATNSTCCWP